MTSYDIRPVTDAEYPAFVKAFIEGFADDIPSDDFDDLIRLNLPPERTLAAFEGEDMVGTFGGYDLSLTVPGGVAVPMEGTTVVTVYPTHRRQGLLRDMMQVHLDNAVAAGYPIAGLWASESGIYERFGYGIAAYGYAVKMEGSHIRFRDGVEVDRVRRISVDEAFDVLPPIFDAVCRRTPGMWKRSENWWKDILADADWMKHGRTKLRIVIHDGDDGPDGYAIYRLKGADSDDWHDAGEVRVIEAMAQTPRAIASLWSFLTNVDMRPTVKYNFYPMDDMLAPMITEGRRIQKKIQYESLYVRLLDVERALEARTYEHDGDIVIEVEDAILPATSGRYRLTVTAGIASCERTEDDADVSMDVDVLGGLYLGGQNAYAYAGAGRLRGADLQVDTLHRIFRTAKQPWCNWVF